MSDTPFGTQTVAQLIERLKELPQDRPVLAWAPGAYWGISSPFALKAPDDTPVVLLELNRLDMPSTKL